METPNQKITDIEKLTKRISALEKALGAIVVCLEKQGIIKLDMEKFK